MTSIAENIRSIRERMDRAARAAGRDPGEITLWPQRHGTDGFYICRMRRQERKL